MKECKDKNINTANLSFLIGDCGTGKTTVALAMARKYLAKGYPCYSNVYMEGLRKFTVEDFMVNDFGKGAVLVLDESATYGLASRGNNARKSTTQEIVEFFTMYRHYQFEHIIIISPSFQDVIPVVRSRIVRIIVCKTPIITQMFLMPINLVRMLMDLTPIKVTLLKYIKKHIDICNNGGASEPMELYTWIPLKRSYYIQNKYYKYFDSFCRKPLAKKKWEVWGVTK